MYTETHDLHRINRFREERSRQVTWRKCDIKTSTWTGLIIIYSPFDLLFQKVNEQTFSQQCWPEPGVYFTLITLYTLKFFCHQENKKIFLCLISLLMTSAGPVLVQPSLSITVNTCNRTNFWRPQKTMKGRLIFVIFRKSQLDYNRNLYLYQL